MYITKQKPREEQYLTGDGVTCDDDSAGVQALNIADLGEALTTFPPSVPIKLESAAPPSHSGSSYL